MSLWHNGSMVQFVAFHRRLWTAARRSSSASWKILYNFFRSKLEKVTNKGWGAKKPLMHLENRIWTGCRGINSPDRKRKAVGQKRQDSTQVDERYILRRVGRYTAYFDWPRLRCRTNDTSAESSSPEGGICCFRLKTMSVTTYMMLVLSLWIWPREICCEILDILESKAR